MISDQVMPPIVMIGGGGHAAVLMDILLKQGRKVLAVVSPDDISRRQVFSGIQCLSRDEQISNFSPVDVRLVNGIGMLPKSKLRQRLNDHFLAMGYQFETVIAPEAIVSKYSTVLEGAQVFSGAIIQAGALIGPHSIINTGAIVEHDCVVGRYNHVAPRALVCGQVTTHDSVFVGASATVAPGIELGQGSVLGAGATLLKSLAPRQFAYGPKVTSQAIE